MLQTRSTGALNGMRSELTSYTKALARGRTGGAATSRLAIVAGALIVLFSSCLPADWGARAILHPLRRPISKSPDLPYEDISFINNSVRLRGWLLRAGAPHHGLIVYLHGIADNRQSGLGIARRFVPRGYDVLIYDGRAHGASTGQHCTYGYHEKRDLSLALDRLGSERGSTVVLIGHSLGAAVALQAAAVEPRVSHVIAVSSFSDLDSIVRDRAPWFVTSQDVTAAMALASRRGDFIPAEASPRRSATMIRVPVLLVHGECDRETTADHSRRIFDSLSSPKELVIVPGADHDHILSHDGAWTAIDEWWRRHVVRPHSR